MTRMWMLQPETMCREHLIGEHAELHQLVGTILRHPHGKAIAEGHAKKGNIETRYIGERHRELVTEMNRRGYNHNSPMEYEDNVDIGTVNIQDNVNDLIGRCKHCRRRREKYFATHDRP